MSPYGSSEDRPRCTTLLPPFTIPLKASSRQPPAVTAAPDEPFSLVIFHVTLDSIPADLIPLLHDEFSAELQRGNSYPQQGPIDIDAFKAYFFAADVFVGIAVTGQVDTPTTLELARAERSWSSCVWGFYYICNGGFVVINEFRGRGVGGVLAQSFLHFAPRLGYLGSIFNLVYASNTASLALWDRLGFTRVGVVPKAGRLKQADGTEAYVDAFIIYKSFEEAEIA
ncbi:hypothetical protein FRB97_005419 [Tulasnella sp. 331]|nr:hypothetical protein FRB97_005419 [Tulasnella sp. 331]